MCLTVHTRSSKPELNFEFCAGEFHESDVVTTLSSLLVVKITFVSESNNLNPHGIKVFQDLNLVQKI